MRISLVTPPYNLLRQGYGTKIYSKYGAYPPLGLGYIASALEEAGHVVNIVDAQSALLDNEGIFEKLCNFDCEAVGISTVTATERSACELANFIKARRDMSVFMGGPHPTCFPESVFRKAKDIDFLVIGEGEETVKEIMGLIEDKERWGEVDGLCFLDANLNFIRTKERQSIHDLDKIRPPARYLYDSGLYHPIPNLYLQLPATNMITSRGCPYGKCAFCYEAGRIGQRYRRHSPERVVGEIKELIGRYGIREIAFWDDNFIVGHDWVKRFCNLLVREEVNISWSCYSRVDMVNGEILNLLAAAGCWSIFYGLESGTQELLDIVNKGITLGQIRTAIRLTHKAGIESRGSFMLALPGENPQLAKKTIDFAIELNLDSVQFLATYPEYGTKLYEKAVTKGQFMEYKGRHGVTYVPDGYKGAEEVKKIIRIAYLRFYLRPAFFLKYLKKVKGIKGLLRFMEGFKMAMGIAWNR